MIYTTENLVSQWLLSPDGKNVYLFEGNKKLGEDQNNLLYHLARIDVLNKSATTLSSEINYNNYYSDALLWAPDYQSFKWTTQDKESKNYYLYSFNLATREINKEELKSADTTYGPISWNLSPSQKKYASHEFFGKEIFIYHLDSKIMEKIPVGLEIDNSRIWWGGEDKYVLVSTRKKSSSIAELRVVNLADKSNKVIIENEENIQNPGPFPYKLTKYGYLIEYNRKLYLYTQEKEKIAEISGINISHSTVGIKDF